jgi:hypothetical protein
MTKRIHLKFLEEFGVDQNFFWRTICTDVYIFNLARDTRDIDHDGRGDTHHVSFGINVMRIKWNYDVTDYLTQSRSKIILFDSSKLWEKIRAMMHIIPRFVRTIHGLNDSFIRRKSLIEEVT